VGKKILPYWIQKDTCHILIYKLNCMNVGGVDFEAKLM
jgi:hypothetical protein